MIKACRLIVPDGQQSDQSTKRHDTPLASAFTSRIFHTIMSVTATPVSFSEGFVLPEFPQAPQTLSTLFHARQSFCQRQVKTTLRVALLLTAHTA
jgi:hypothetical protein